jgi:hypothetical protein
VRSSFVHTTPLSEGTRKSLSSVGAAHHALRAYVWACNQRATGQAQYRYQLSADQAAVIDQSGDVLAAAPLETWATTGRTIRTALVGLKYVCDRVEQASALARKFEPARLHMDALAETASIVIAGRNLPWDEVSARANEWWLSEAAIRILVDTRVKDFNTIAAWSRLGRQLELDFFFTLQGAETYGLEAAALAERERGCRIGIICRPRQLTASKTASPSQTGGICLKPRAGTPPVTFS